MNAREQLLMEIEVFLSRHGIPETSFGVKAVRDPSLVAKLRKGRSVRLDMADRLRAFMRDYKPDRIQKKRHDAHAA